MPLPSAHLISQPIHRNAEQPGLESAVLLISSGNLRRNGTEGGLGQLLGQVGITTLHPKEAEHARGIAIDDRAPCDRIPRGGPKKQRGDVVIGFRIHVDEIPQAVRGRERAGGSTVAAR